MTSALQGRCSIFFWAALSLLVPAAAAQQDNPTTKTLKNIGQQALTVVLHQNALDSFALLPKTGKPLRANGRWLISQYTPPTCPQTGADCVRVIYHVPKDDLVCWWVVQLNSDGSDGIILQQNDAATQYFVRKLTASQAGQLVLTRKNARYLPVAREAHLQGTVVARAIVSTAGTVDQVYIVSGLPALSISAYESLKGWVFKPLIAGNQPVRFETDITFEFKTETASGTFAINTNP